MCVQFAIYARVHAVVVVVVVIASCESYLALLSSRSSVRLSVEPTCKQRDRSHTPIAAAEKKTQQIERERERDCADFATYPTRRPSLARKKRGKENKNTRYVPFFPSSSSSHRTLCSRERGERTRPAFFSGLKHIRRRR